MKKTVYVTFRLKIFLMLLVCFLLIFSIIILISMSASINTASVITEKGFPLIIVDAGHGGADGGTQSSSGILEKHINLEIAKKVNALLLSLGYNTAMTRTDDSLIYGDGYDTIREKKVYDIRKRMSIIEENPNSIFLSIHQNFFTESKYNGAQVFYSPNNEESSNIAKFLQDSIVQNLQKDNTREIKKSGKEIYLLYHAQSPAVMVECGFLSNPVEAKLLNDEEYQKEMSLAIVAGITEYLNNF